MTQHSTIRLAELVRRKHDVLVKLCEIGCRQREIVESQETNSLLKLLAVKQTMINLLQQIERDLAPYHSEDPEARIWSSPDARICCAELSANCHRMLQEIVALEQETAVHMESRRNEVAAQLKQVVAAGQARHAYEAHK
jgi:hypothetical protein